MNGGFPGDAMRFCVAVALFSLFVFVGCSGGSKQPPVANAGGPYPGTVGMAVSFTGAASSDPQDENLTYLWNFGDGGTGTGVSPTHNYTAPGTYTVTLTVTNTSNLAAMATSKATIAPAPPMANTGGPYSGTEGVALNFNASGSMDLQGETLTYAWNFGDGGTGTGVGPTHTYAATGTYNVTLTVTNTSNLSTTATTTVLIPNGRVYGGLQPIAQAHVYLFAANTTGYGQASVSLLAAASTGTSDSVGAYVLTGADGGFLWNGDYSCTPGAQVYLYALGGNAGAGTNTAAGLMAVLGNCPITGNFSAVPYITVNEVSTIAAAYAFAGFATDATHVSSSGTALAQVGIANAFANAANLVTLSTGTALATTPAGNGTAPQTEINTLANILATCIETSGPGSNGCELLFSNAMSSGSTGTAPPDTATAAINIAHNPTTNIAGLYALASSSVFTPKLAAQPNDFTMLLYFTGGGVAYPYGIAIDGSGDVWTTNFNNNSITELSSLGAALSGANGFTGSGLSEPCGIAIDRSGNAWVSNTNGNSVTKLSNTGSVLAWQPSGNTTNGPNGSCGISVDASGNAWVTNSYDYSVTKFSGSSSYLSGTIYTGGGIWFPTEVTVDGSGNAWIANVNATSSVIEISSSGRFVSGATGYTGILLILPSGQAVDGSGNVWFTVGYGNSCSGCSNVIELSNNGTVLSGTNGFSGIGSTGSTGIAIDGSGNAWVASEYGGRVTEFSSLGTILSGPNGFDPYHTLNSGSEFSPYGIAIDGSGNVWNSNPLVNLVTELVGAATPVITPIAAGLPVTPTADGSSKLGTRP